MKKSRHSCHLGSFEETNPNNKKEVDRVLVFVRVRPLSSNEQENGAKSCVECTDKLSIGIRKEGQRNAVLRSQKGQFNEYTYDEVFGPESGHLDIYGGVAANHVPNILHGINVTILAYGATGSGKTHTMMGCIRDNSEASDRLGGVIPTAFSHIFEEIERAKLTQGRDGSPGHPGSKWSLKVSYCQVYNENVYDLISPSEPPVSLKVLEDTTQGAVIVQGLSEVHIQTPQQGVGLVVSGNENRTTEATAANNVSSRSHAILSLIVREEWKDEVTGDMRSREAKLCLVDLAGSERASATLNGGVRLQEGAKINRSLLALANCIHKLADHDNEHQENGKKKVVRRGSTGSTPGSVVNYRDSKLTHLLKTSLEGKCRMIMIANINPNNAFYEDSHNTLKYANRAKEIKVTAGSREPVVSCSEIEAKLEKARKVKGEHTTEKKKEETASSKNRPVWITGKASAKQKPPKKSAPVVRKNIPMDVPENMDAVAAERKLESEILELKAQLAEQQNIPLSNEEVEDFDHDYMAPSADEILESVRTSIIVQCSDESRLEVGYIAPSAEQVIASKSRDDCEHKRKEFGPYEEDEHGHKRLRETDSSLSMNESYDTLPMPPARLAPPPPPIPLKLATSLSSSSPLRFHLASNALSDANKELFTAAVADAVGAAMKKRDAEESASVRELTSLLGGAKSEIAILRKSLETSNKQISELKQALANSEVRAEAVTCLQQERIQMNARIETLLAAGFSKASMPSSVSTSAPSTVPVRRSLENITNAKAGPISDKAIKTSSSSPLSSVDLKMFSDEPKQTQSVKKIENVPSCGQNLIKPKSATHAFLKSKRWTRSSAKSLEAKNEPDSLTNFKKAKSLR